MKYTLNEQAWFMHEFMGMSYKEIGEELNYSKSGVHAIVTRPMQRAGVAKVVKKMQRYCKNDCQENHCRECHLLNFQLRYLVRKEL